MPVHDSPGGSARAVALQLHLTPAVDVTTLLETAHMGPVLGTWMGQVYVPHSRVKVPTVAPSGPLISPRQRAISEAAARCRGGGVPNRPWRAGLRAMTQSGLTGGWHPRYPAGCLLLHPALALKLVASGLGIVSSYSGETSWRSFALRSGQHTWKNLDEPPAGADLRTSVEGFWHNAGCGGLPALVGVMQDEAFD